MATTTTSTTNYSELVVDMIRSTAEQEMVAKYHFTDPANGFVTGFFAKGTDTIVFPRYANLAAHTTSISEGHTPTGVELSIDSEYVTAVEYGNVVEVSNRAQRHSPHNLFAIAAEKAGAQMALSIHTLVRNTCQAGTNILYANGSTESAVSATMTGAMVKRCVAYLRKHNVPTFSDGTYHGIITTEQGSAVMSDTATGGWIDIKKYAEARALLNGEIGSYAGVRFVDAGSEGFVDADAGASSADLHSAFIFGPEAYGIAGIDEMQGTYVGPGGHDDPLGLIAKAGWHVEAFGTLLLDAAGARYVRLKTAETTI
jgi:N4-gp56 family major capsid protein